MNSFWRGETESLRVGDQFVLTVIEIGSTTIRFWLEDTHHPDESRIVEIDRPDIEYPGDRSDDHFFAYSNVPLDARCRTILRGLICRTTKIYVCIDRVGRAESLGVR